MSLSNRLMCQRIMVTNWHAWQWLDGYCSEQIGHAASRHTHQPVVQDIWLHRLAHDVRNILENRTTSKDFDPASYGIDARPNHIFNYQCRSPPLLVGEEELNTQSIKLGVKIIASWLDFPLNNLARFQAWFVNCICQAWGQGALLLDEVWKAYTHLSWNVLGGRKADAAIEALENLFFAMKSHPLASQKSDESRALKNLAGLLAQVRPDTFKDETIEFEESIDMLFAANDEAELTPRQLPHGGAEVDTEMQEPYADVALANDAGMCKRVVMMIRPP
ncbi:hypothetical protein K438DRAFT_1992732 [Mycena galopus ATCC 62051]|nr:hypothetical protein K438DRAFT_1992732 [Mycena galopus ATCC 62051]